MSIIRKIEIDEKEVLLKASAAIPRIYCLKFQRDIYKDLRMLEQSVNGSEEGLDGFNTFSIYQVLPKLMELWGLNVQTDVEAKKTSSNRAGNDNTFVPPAVCAVGGCPYRSWNCCPLD